MPFTTSHPAIIIPLKKLWPRLFSLSGLAAGAMSPDLIYFVTGTTEWRHISHTWPGLFMVCIPLGLIFAMVFHWLVKYQLIRHLPGMAERLLEGLGQSSFQLNTTRSIVILFFSVTVGALSHFFWDAFTHPGGYIADRIPFLSQTVNIFGYERQFCRVLQHVSSLSGVLVIAGAVIWGNIIPNPIQLEESLPSSNKLLFWLGGALFGLAGAFIAGTAYGIHFGWEWNDSYGQTLRVTSFGLGSWAGLFYWIIIYGLFKKQSRFNQSR